MYCQSEWWIHKQSDYVLDTDDLPWVHAEFFCLFYFFINTAKIDIIRAFSSSDLISYLIEKMRHFNGVLSSNLRY